MGHKENVVYTSFGFKGQGKTTIAKILLNLMWASCKKIAFIIDPKKEFDNKDDRILNCKVFHNFDDICSYFQEPESWQEAKRRGLRIILQTDKEDDVLALLQFIYDNLEKVIIFVDEADLFIDTSASKEHPMRKIARYGRNSEIDLITTSKRPANIHRDLTSQTDKMILFRASEPRDLNYLKEFCTPEVIEEVQNLKPLEFIYFDNNLRCHHKEQISKDVFQHITELK